jgi:hypothetical protein
LCEQAELFAVFSSGTHTPATLQFFQTVGSEQVMGKVYRVVDTACSLIETVAVHHLIPAVEAAILALACLKGKTAVDVTITTWTVDDLTVRLSSLQNMLLLVRKLSVKSCVIRGGLSCDGSGRLACLEGGTHAVRVGRRSQLP